MSSSRAILISALITLTILISVLLQRSDGTGMPSGGGCCCGGGGGGGGGGGCCCQQQTCCCQPQQSCCCGGGGGGGGFGGLSMGSLGGGGGGCGCGCGGRRRRRRQIAMKPQYKTEETPCPQNAWKSLMEQNIAPKDSVGSVNAIQAGLYKRYAGQKFLVTCASAEDAAAMADKHPAVANRVHFSSGGDAYCNIVKEHVWCQAISLAA